ncbi:MAG: glycosyltransferase family 2 protein [Ruminococcaceae bacterium]|nr:glycosyltransferase family 2 protein [Oscillospiraceae bacterium]
MECLKLYLVIPCYNEQEVLPITAQKIREKMQALQQRGKITADSKVVFVDDGSKDKTWELICALHKADKLFRGIKLAHNKGHQNALLAGMMTVRAECDAIISMDADLQDDINAIDEMIERCYEGCDIVYGVRCARDKDTAFKRGTAHGFYKVMKWLGVEIVNDHADYRLMTKRALAALADFDEVNLFLRGLVPLLGFKTATVEYERGERAAGESKYPLKKMIAFAMEGITSMSVKPIRLVTVLGFLIFAVSIIMLLYSLIRHLIGATVTGWTSTVVSIWAIGGLQLLAIGVIGEYIGKIYLETKHRPKYTVEEYLK